MSGFLKEEASRDNWKESHICCRRWKHPEDRIKKYGTFVGFRILFTFILSCSLCDSIMNIPLPAYCNNSFTFAEIARPSASPANFLEATPITLPISFPLVAPVSAMISFNATSSSSAVICLGK